MKRHFIQQQPITIPLRAEGAVEFEMPAGPRAATSSHIHKQLNVARLWQKACAKATDVEQSVS